MFFLQYVGYLGFSNTELFLDFYGSFKKSITGSNLLVYFPSLLFHLLSLPTQSNYCLKEGICSASHSNDHKVTF